MKVTFKKASSPDKENTLQPMATFTRATLKTINTMGKANILGKTVVYSKAHLKMVSS